MKKLLPVIILMFSSCGIFHFFPPGVNNIISDTHWNEKSSFNGVSASALYSITLDNKDTIYLGYVSSAGSNIVTMAYNNDSSMWDVIDSPPNIASSVNLKYRADMGLCIGYINPNAGGGGVLKFKNENENTWRFYSINAFGDQTTALWDYALSTGDKAFTAYTLSTNYNVFAVNDLATPYTNSVWKHIMLSPYNTGNPISDITIDIDSFGKLFIGVATSFSSAIFYTIDNISKSFVYNEGKHFAKVAVDGSDNIYGIYMEKDGPLSAAVFHIKNGELVKEHSFSLYTSPILYDMSMQYSISVAAHKKGSHIYVGFINFNTRKPAILKLVSENISPMLGLPGDLTNAQSIKLSVDMDGNPVAAVLTDTGKVRVFTKW